MCNCRLQLLLSAGQAFTIAVPLKHSIRHASDQASIHPITPLPQLLVPFRNIMRHHHFRCQLCIRCYQPINIFPDSGKLQACLAKNVQGSWAFGGRLGPRFQLLVKPIHEILGLIVVSDLARRPSSLASFVAGQFDYSSCGKPRSVRAWSKQLLMRRRADARLGATTSFRTWMTLWRRAAITCGATPWRIRLWSSPRVTSRR
jgi:hypothetical protein